MKSTARLRQPSLRNMAASVGVAAIALAASAGAAQADFCVRLSGGVFSGDIGFFRFAGTRPSAPGSMTTLAGRAAGLSPVFGSMVVAKDNTFAEIGATFFIDNTQGQMNISFSPPLALTGSGSAGFGEYGLPDSVTAKIVRCGAEP